MRVHSSTRFAAMAVLFGALACAGNTARDTDETAAARDTTTTTDTLQNPEGYRGMERDTTIAPPVEQQPSDTFLQNQGVGTPQDTSGYTGAERVDTTGVDTIGQVNPPQGQMDTTSFRTDTTGAAVGGDTTGYDPSQQQPRDSVYR